MVDFDPVYRKVQIPHFSDLFRLKQIFWIGGPKYPPPNCEIVPYGTFSEIGGSSAPPPSKNFVWAKNFLKNGGFALSDILDQNRPFSRLGWTPRGSGRWPRTKSRAQKGPKTGPFLVHFGFTRKKLIFGFFPDPLEVQPGLGDAGFWSSAQKLGNSQLFSEFGAISKFLDGGATGPPPPISENVPYDRLKKLGRC